MLQALLTGVIGAVVCGSLVFVALAAAGLPVVPTVAFAAVCGLAGFAKVSIESLESD